MRTPDFAGFVWPRRRRGQLWLRPVAPPPLQPAEVSLGETDQASSEDIARGWSRMVAANRPKPRSRPYSEAEAIEQVASLAHREKLPEPPRPEACFCRQWPAALAWVSDFERSVPALGQGVGTRRSRSRSGGVFWALLFRCSRADSTCKQEGGFGRLQIKSGCRSGPPGDSAEQQQQANRQRTRPLAGTPTHSGPAPLPARLPEGP